MALGMFDVILAVVSLIWHIIQKLRSLHLIYENKSSNVSGLIRLLGDHSEYETMSKYLDDCYKPIERLINCCEGYNQNTRLKPVFEMFVQGKCERTEFLAKLRREVDVIYNCVYEERTWMEWWDGYGRSHSQRRSDCLVEFKAVEKKYRGKAMPAVTDTASTFGHFVVYTGKRVAVTVLGLNLHKGCYGLEGGNWTSWGAACTVMNLLGTFGPKVAKMLM